MYELDDPIAELFQEAATAPAPRTVTPPAHFVPALERAHTEPCGKCRGTGQWRPGYRCFGCNGTGKRTFKTSGAKRATNRANAAARKEADRAANAETWKAEHAAEWEWLVAAAVRQGTFDFPAKMLESVMRWGSLTDNQLAPVQRLMARRDRRAEG